MRRKFSAFSNPPFFKTRGGKAWATTDRSPKFLWCPRCRRTRKPHGKSIELLRAKGIDAIIPFRTLLGDLIEQTETNRNYQKSDLLQMIRVLKNYDFFKEPQLELF